MASAEVGSLRVSLTLGTAAFTAGAKVVADTARATSTRIASAFQSGAAMANASLATIANAATKQLGIGLQGEIAKVRTAVATMFGPAGLIIAGLTAAVGHFASRSGEAVGGLNNILDRHNDLTNEIGGLYDAALERGVEYGRGMARVFQLLAQQQLPQLLSDLDARMQATFNPENGIFANRRLMDDFAAFNDQIQDLRGGLIDFDTFMISVARSADQMGVPALGAELIELTQGLRQSANALAAAKQQASGVAFDTPVGGSRERRIAAEQAEQERRQAIQSSIDGIIADNRSLLEAENVGHAERLKALDTALAQDMLKREQHQALVESETMAHEERISEIQRDALEQRRSQQAEWLSLSADILGSFGQLIQGEGEKAFKARKRLALAEAALDGSAAIMKALASAPPPLNFIRAAAVGAATAAQMAAIARSQPGSGATPPVPSGGGAGAGAAAGGGEASGPGQTLTIRGLNRGDLFSGDSVRELAEKLMDFQRNGGKVVYA